MGGHCADTLLHHLRQIICRQDIGTHAVIKVMAQVGNPVRPVHDAPLQGKRHDTAAVMQDAVLHLPCQVQPPASLLQLLQNAQALLIVGKMPRQPVQCRFPGMTEGCMPHIMPHGYGLCQILIQPEAPGYGPANL